MKVYVYHDPISHIPFYVGKGIGNRWASHLTLSTNYDVRDKINMLKAQNLGRKRGPLSEETKAKISATCKRRRSEGE